MVNNFLFCVCVCVLQVTWRANGIVLYMYEGNVLMDKVVTICMSAPYQSCDLWCIFGYICVIVLTIAVEKFFESSQVLC